MGDARDRDVQPAECRKSAGDPPAGRVTARTRTSCCVALETGLTMRWQHFHPQAPRPSCQNREADRKLRW
jgi:hypothetical protein